MPARSNKPMTFVVVESRPGRTLPEVRIYDDWLRAMEYGSGLLEGLKVVQDALTVAERKDGFLMKYAGPDLACFVRGLQISL